VTDIDTAAIRAWVLGIDPYYSDAREVEIIRDLVDALDAARAERDNCKMWHGDNAWCENLLARAEAAEARITAAVAIHDDVRLTDERCAADMYRALTRGTK
jgi:hypothetical protein